MKTLAYIAGEFPKTSETFVYREVRGLRKRGWRVIGVSLNHAENSSSEMDDLMRDRIVVYGEEKSATIFASLSDRFAHPVRTIHTRVTELGDVIYPGESLGLSARVKLPLQAFAGIGLARRLRTLGVEHIHCHFAHAPTTVGMYAAMQMGVPFSFTGHANDIFQRRALLKKKLRRAAFVACISEWHREFYNSIEPDTEGKYEVIRCGVEPSPLSCPGVQGEGETLKILTICRLVEKKGVDTLIAAAAELNRRGIRTRLTIAGDGPDAQRLKKIAGDLHGGDWLVWLGAVSNTKVPCLLDDADVMALPCREDSSGDRDGIPVVLMEAMASGTPVVAGDLPAIRELVVDGQSGILVEGNNPKMLADKLAMLWGNPGLRQRLTVEGRKKIETEFSLATNLDRLERRFNETAQAAKNPHPNPPPETCGQQYKGRGKEG
jgi:glycosyltransferase involved in cell wall biosynthesis